MIPASVQGTGHSPGTQTLSPEKGNSMNDLEFLTHVIDEKSQKILDANDKIWEYAELAFHETKSAELL